MSTITLDLEQALRSLQQQRVVAIPTETVYGLAADASAEEAVAQIFVLKNRPRTHPLILHVAPEWDLSPWVRQIPEYAQQLMNALWPGPLTLVLPAHDINPLITGGQSTVAIRAPQHPLALALLRRLGRPLVAPSANRFGKISPTTAQHVHESFLHDELLILDGGRCTVGIESTIILATSLDHYKILRHGLIDEACIVQHTSCTPINTPSNVRVSGALAHHYQPEKPLYYAEAIERTPSLSSTYVLSFHDTFALGAPWHVQLPRDASGAAYELYYQLRRADASGATQILIELPPASPHWDALRDRIMKAGAAWPKDQDI